MSVNAASTSKAAPLLQAAAAAAAEAEAHNSSREEASVDYRQVAIKVLTNAGKAMLPGEIALRYVGGDSPDGKRAVKLDMAVAYSKIAAALYSDLKHKDKSVFTFQPDEGLFGLSAWGRKGKERKGADDAKAKEEAQGNGKAPSSAATDKAGPSGSAAIPAAADNDPPAAEDATVMASLSNETQAQALKALSESAAAAIAAEDAIALETAAQKKRKDAPQGREDPAAKKAASDAGAGGGDTDVASGDESAPRRHRRLANIFDDVLKRAQAQAAAQAMQTGGVAEGKSTPRAELSPKSAQAEISTAVGAVSAAAAAAAVAAISAPLSLATGKVSAQSMQDPAKLPAVSIAPAAHVLPEAPGLSPGNPLVVLPSAATAAVSGVAPQVLAPSTASRMLGLHAQQPQAAALADATGAMPAPLAGVSSHAPHDITRQIQAIAASQALAAAQAVPAQAQAVRVPSVNPQVNAGFENTRSTLAAKAAAAVKAAQAANAAATANVMAAAQQMQQDQQSFGGQSGERVAKQLIDNLNQITESKILSGQHSNPRYTNMVIKQNLMNMRALEAKVGSFHPLVVKYWYKVFQLMKGINNDFSQVAMSKVMFIQRKSELIYQADKELQNVVNAELRKNAGNAQHVAAGVKARSSQLVGTSGLASTLAAAEGARGGGMPMVAGAGAGAGAGASAGLGGVGGAGAIPLTANGALAGVTADPTTAGTAAAAAARNAQALQMQAMVEQQGQLRALQALQAQAAAGAKPSILYDAAGRPVIGDAARRLVLSPPSPAMGMDDVLVLWEEISVPLYHRARFYGGPGNTELRDSPSVLGLELARLGWLREYVEANPDFKKRAEADLEAERSALVEGLWAMPQMIRKNLLRSWGLNPKVPNGQRKIIQALVAQLWTPAMAPEKSATIVLMLNDGTLDRKTRFVHFLSLYAMAAQGAIQLGGTQPSAVVTGGGVQRGGRGHVRDGLSEHALRPQPKSGRLVSVSPQAVSPYIYH